jgi:DNA replication protein DnaC
VFGCSSSQEEVYSHTRDLVATALDGFNVCILAYGQTGSGKTHTMVCYRTTSHRMPTLMVDADDVCCTM